MSRNLSKESKLINEIRDLIEETRKSVAQFINAGMSMLYWRIGKRINEEILRGRRATYGKQVVSSLAKKLTVDYGRAFSEKNFRRVFRDQSGI